MTNSDIPDPRDEPLQAAEAMLKRIQADMSDSDLSDHEKVQLWAVDIGWALTALAEHEDYDDD